MFRYLKNVFPKVEETMLLDILEQSDNNVQKASEKLIDRSLTKRKEEEQVIYISVMLYFAVLNNYSLF